MYFFNPVIDFIKALFASWVLEGRGRKGLWRGKPLFGSFKKIGKDFGGF